jgi:flagellar biosynthesis chaperone FliJ
MAKFVFELEAVLKARKAVERTRMLEMAVVERERLGIESRLRELQRRISEEKSELRGQLAGDGAGGLRAGVSGAGLLDLRGVRFQAGSALRLIAGAQRAVLELAGVHARLERARRLLLEAATARKAVEALRDRRREAWMMEQKRADERVMDELAVVSHASRERGE